MVDVPYTFTAGTTAKASEVNANFKSLEDGVNNNSSSIDRLDNDLSELSNNKANKEGNKDVQFKVGNATTDYDAVNKKMLESYVGNLVYYINGLVISKDSDDSIKITSGQCYDTTKTYRLELEEDIIETNASQAVNKEYSVFIVGDKGYNGETTNISININETNQQDDRPSGITEDNAYRKIGSYKTNNDNEISVVNSMSNTSTNEYGRFIEVNTEITANTDLMLSEVLPQDGHSYMLWVYNSIGWSPNAIVTYITTDLFSTRAFNEVDESRSVSIVYVPASCDGWVRTTRNSTLLGYMRI